MSHEIHKVGVRKDKALAPRREPYWGAPLSDGKYLGYRKISDTRGSWIARMRDPDTERQVYKALGQDTTTFDYTAAVAAASKWFKAREQGISDEPLSVKQACEKYLENRRQVKGEACAQDNKKRFERTVYGSQLATVQLAKIRTPQITDWFSALKLSKASANRTLTALKAAMNYAVKKGLVDAEVMFKWRGEAVEPYPDADGRRTLYLDLEQRQALLAAATGAVRDLIAGVMLTGCRAGELTSALRSQFDHRTKCMEFNGKTGKRTVPLSPAAVTLFTRLTKLKLPAAHLFVRDDGKPWAHSDWDELVRDAAKRAELPEGVCLYTLRHSFVTAAIGSGMSILEVARLVGTSLQMVDQNYGHLVAADARKRLAALQMA
jgi:integrase